MAETFTLRARWLLPIDRPPIRDGWIDVRDGRIAAIGTGASPGPARDLGEVAVLPGLVNAHTHLELSWMDGLVRQAASMPEWIAAMLAVRRGRPPAEADQQRVATEAARVMRATGTVLVGDVSNTLLSAPALGEAGLAGVVFHELLGFNEDRPRARVEEAAARVRDVERDMALGGFDVRVGLAAHAPYSVSAAMFRAVAAERRRTPLTVHLGESAEEVEFLRTGTGRMRDLLEQLGAWDPDWRAPGCDPVEFLRRVGYLERDLLAVHAVHLTDDALGRLRRVGATIVTCPRSNIHVGAGMPRVPHFYAAGVRVAIGTDSLASAPSLNLFDELAELRRIAPDVSASSLLESATRVGAEALGYGETHGTLAPGKRAALIAVDIPARVGDVEEYLVGGVPAEAVHTAFE